jgi:LssY-like putative type I secretion system component LssY
MSVLPSWQRVFANVTCAGSVALALAGCANWQAPAEVSDAALRARASTTTVRDVRVTAAVLSARDSVSMLGADVTKTNVQPVWVEVENRTPQPLWLLRSGTDPDYFSPLEIAWSMHTPLGGGTNARIDEHFDSLGFKSPILPGATRTGVLFTQPQPRTKLLNVDLFGTKTLIPFSLFLPVPDAMDDRSRPLLFQYPEPQVTDYQDLAALRGALERLPCCATDAAGTVQGEPLNAVFIGTFEDIGAASIRRSYRRDLDKSDLAQRVFGREADLVARKRSQAGAPATWIRAWLAPMRFEGKAVFVVQVGRPVGGRFAPRQAESIVLHEDVDEARNLLIQDMMYSGGLEKLGFITGVGAAAEALPRTALNGARYYTDGLRAVLFFGTRPLSLSDVEMLDWVPFLEGRQAAAREQGHDAHE